MKYPYSLKSIGKQQRISKSKASELQIMDLEPPISTKCPFLPNKVMKDPSVIGSGMGGNAVSSIINQF